MYVAEEIVFYKSLIRKLATLFEKSRNNWKEKCLVTKKELKQLKNSFLVTEESRNKWREEALYLRKQTKLNIPMVKTKSIKSIQKII